VGGGIVNRNNIKEIVSYGVTVVCVVQIGTGGDLLCRRQ
jgi:hypothetical protein